MSFRRDAFRFAHDLVEFVLRDYLAHKYQPLKPKHRRPPYRLRTRAWEEEERPSQFLESVGMAAVALQPRRFPPAAEQNVQAVEEMLLAPGAFAPARFLRCCALMALLAAEAYCHKANFSLPEHTVVAIATLLVNYHDDGSFQEHRDWDALHRCAESVLQLDTIFKWSQEFVPQNNQYWFRQPIEE